jgi:hypothetical protein
MNNNKITLRVVKVAVAGDEDVVVEEEGVEIEADEAEAVVEQHERYRPNDETHGNQSHDHPKHFPN